MVTVMTRNLFLGDFTAGLWPSDHAGVVATLEPAA